MGETERHVFEGLLIFGALIWIICTRFTTWSLAQALFESKAGSRPPFIVTLLLMGLIHVFLSCAYLLATYWTQVWVVRVTVWSIPISTILLGFCSLYLGVAAWKARQNG